VLNCVAWELSEKILEDTSVRPLQCENVPLKNNAVGADENIDSVNVVKALQLSNVCEKSVTNTDPVNKSVGIDVIPVFLNVELKFDAETLYWNSLFGNVVRRALPSNVLEKSVTAMEPVKKSSGKDVISSSLNLEPKVDNELSNP